MSVSFTNGVERPSDSLAQPGQPSEEPASDDGGVRIYVVVTALVLIVLASVLYLLFRALKRYFRRHSYEFQEEDRLREARFRRLQAEIDALTSPDQVEAHPESRTALIRNRQAFLENHLPSSKYRPPDEVDQDGVADSDTTCLICLGDYEEGDIVTHSNFVPRECRHQFHHCCASTWLVKCRKCPLCLRIFLAEDAGMRPRSNESIIISQDEENQHGGSERLGAQEERDGVDVPAAEEAV